MIPPVIHFTVLTPPSELELRCIAQARELHPGWKIYVWEGDDGLPDGRLSKYIRRARSGAQRADLIRLDVVARYGGFYLDRDMVPSRSLEPLRQFDCMLLSTEDGIFLTNAAFGAPPGHPAVEALIERLLEHEPDWSLPPHLTTGPGLFSEVLRYRRDVLVLPKVCFYPIDFGALPWRQRVHHLWFCRHLWQASWLPVWKRIYWTAKGWLRDGMHPFAR
jgi:mannosyltransferase OCH1-like enzyme